MAKINLCVPLVSLDGEAIKDEKKETVLLSKFVANRIVGEKNNAPLVAFEVAKRLYNCEGEIEVNAIELTIIETAAKSDNISTLVAGQVLNALSGAKKK